MKTTVRALACILAVAPLFACGDDAPTTTDKAPIAAVDSSVANPGAKPPAVTDGSVAADTGVRADGGAPADAGAPSIDAALAADAGRDSSAPRTDSGSTGTDAGGGTDSGQTAGPTGPAFSQACLACEAKSCSTTYYNPDVASTDLTKACAALVGVAEAGPGKGKPRSQLCQELVECGRRTGCAHPTEFGCLCGPLELGACQAKSEADGIANLPGPCVKEVRAAGEAVDLDIRPLIDTYTAPAYGTSLAGLGTAIQLLQCSEAVCTDECYAPCASKPDQTACDTVGSGGDFGKTSRTCMAGSCPDSPTAEVDLGLVPAGDAGVR